MSAIDELVAELCPDGVEYKTLSEMGELIRGKRFVWKDVVPNGKPCIHYSELYTTYGLATKKAVSYLDEDKYEKLRFANPGDVVIVGAGETVEDIGIGVAWLGTEPAAVHDACYIYKHSKALDPMFISYYLRSNYYHSQITRYVSSAKISSISAANIGRAFIPVPPIEVQREIVRILNPFTELIDELTTRLAEEAAARRQQYAHYRDEAIRNCSSIKWLALSEISKNCDRDRKPIKIDQRIAGCTPYYGASGVVDYVDGFTHDGDYLLISEDGANLLARSTPIAFQVSGRNWINNHAHVLRIDNAQLRLFIEIYLNSISLESYISKGAQPKLTKQKMETIKVPVPSESDLSRIVGILDKFDSLTTSLTDCLPAEIEARQAQYAHYRDHLLDFPRKEVAAS